MAYETTDAFAFLNVEHPPCAWAVYRAFLVAKFDPTGFLNARSTAVFKRNDGVLTMELRLEDHRRKHFSQRVSRLDGFFCFLERESALRAQKWPGRHFSGDFLAELSLEEAGSRRDRLDSNWITNAGTTSMPGEQWMSHYWNGDRYPDESPIWECIVDGKIVVLGTEIRDWAARVIEKEIPDSVTFLEISRLAALVGLELGAVAAFARRDGDWLHIEYYMNIVEVNDPGFLARLKALLDSGEPVNWNYLGYNMRHGSFGPTPDFRKYCHRIPLHEMKT